MVVVAAIAILAAVALPSYQEHIRKSRRLDAQAAMMEASQFMEREFTRSNSYADADPSAIFDRVSDFYTLSISDEATSFTITATPTAKQSADKCSTMTLSHTGARTPSLAGCWN